MLKNNLDCAAGMVPSEAPTERRGSRHFRVKSS